MPRDRDPLVIFRGFVEHARAEARGDLARALWLLKSLVRLHPLRAAIEEAVLAEAAHAQLAQVSTPAPA